MARQKGMFPIEGTMGGVIFYKTEHGYLARSKGGIAKERIANDDKFIRTRETGSEFGYCSRMGKLLRMGVKNCCPYAERRDTHYRLSGRLMDIVQQNGTHIRGERCLEADVIDMLQGFEWRLEARLSELLRRGYTLSVDASTGMLQCDINGLVAGRDVSYPAGTTHVQVVLGGVMIDDAGGKWWHARAGSGMLDIGDGEELDVSLSCAVPLGSGRLLFAGIGVEAYQEVAGVMNVLKDRCGFGIVRGVIR